MRTLVIPDIHNKIGVAESIIQQEPHNLLLLLGDFFDDYGDSPSDALNTAKWLKDKLYAPNTKVLFGNHDFGYMYPRNQYASCSGYTKEKNEAIRSVLTQDDFSRLAYYHADHQANILFTHAGLCNWFVKRWAKDYSATEPTLLQAICTYLDQQTSEVPQLYEMGSQHLLMGAGYDRGGWNEVGGIIWADFRNHHPIPGIRQVFGHTKQSLGEPTIMGVNERNRIPVRASKAEVIGVRASDATWSMCLDTNLHSYMVLDGDIMELKQVTWVEDQYALDKVKATTNLVSFNLKKAN
jgi:hypothetical protein